MVIVTASNDKTIGLHRMSEDRLIEKTILKIAIEEKVYDMVVGGGYESIYLADLTNVISRFNIKY